MRREARKKAHKKEGLPKAHGNLVPGGGAASRRVEPASVARRFFFLLAAASMLFALTSCSGSTSTTTTSDVTLSITPPTISLNVGMTTTFLVTAMGGTQNTATLSVNGIFEGNASLGTITPAGAYTAPPTVPSGGTVSVVATSNDDTTVQAISVVTILPPAQVSIAPLQTTLAAGATLPFTATVTGAGNGNTSVTWEVNGQVGGFAAYGFISNTGIYQAPPSPPPGATVTITAVSQADTTQSASATVALSFGTASLNGSYAFTFHGKNAAGPFSRAGSFFADGAGNLQGGLEDVHDAIGVRNISFVGTYTLGPDGRGALVFQDGLAPANFRAVMAGNNQLQIVAADSSGSAQGMANLQDTSAFLTSALNGVFVFDFDGVDSSSKAVSEIGEFFADGKGGIQNGLQDTNDNGTIGAQVPFTGTYAVNANGRGTAQFVAGAETFNFVFYVVSRGSVEFLEVDPSPAAEVAGSAAQQTPNVTFTQSSLNGNYAFLIGGSSPAGDIATAGSFSAAGNGILASGVLDENNNGTVTSSQSFTGSYTIGATGRGTATFQAPNRTYSMVFYLAQGSAVFQETDSSIISDGVLTAQQGAPFSQSTFLGSYALDQSGTNGTAAQSFEGQFNLNSGGAITAGTLDSNTFPGSPVIGEALTGTLTIGANGRGALALNPASDNRNFVVYAATPALLFTVGTDSGRVAGGSVFKQF